MAVNSNFRSIFNRFRDIAGFIRPEPTVQVSKCTGTEYIGLIDMHPATLHGVRVITKLYFAIFAAFKELVTLNLAQRSFKVIDFGTNR